MNMNYISRGTDKLVIEKFIPIENTNTLDKPIGGLWACEYTPNSNYVSAWDQYQVSVGDVDMDEWYTINTILFNLKSDARIYTIDSHEDLIRLFTDFEWKSSEYIRCLTNSKDCYFWSAFEEERYEGDRVDFYLDLAIEAEEELKNIPYEKKVIDFEELSSKYDAIFLTQDGLNEIKNSSDSHFSAWDIPSLLVLNFNAIADQQSL